MKKKRKIIYIFLTALICLNLLWNKVEADVGSFESYDSGGSSWSSSSSSWDSSSSSSSWDWDDDDDYYYSSSSSSRRNRESYGGSEIVFFIIIWVIAIAIGIAKSKHQGPLHRTNRVSYQPTTKNNSLSESEVEQKIRQVDELFNKEEFISWAKNLFVKLQQAWTERDWSTIRTFETVELFEQHKNQLQGYINNNQINVMDRICVNYANLCDFRQEGDKDVLVIRLNSRMTDYIVDATSGQVIRGDKYTERVNTYLMTFIRKTGVKTKSGTGEINTTNCPNCGAPTQITSSGKCEYCGSIITTGEHDWVLSNLERDNSQVNQQSTRQYQTINRNY